MNIILCGPFCGGTEGGFLPISERVSGRLRTVKWKISWYHRAHASLVPGRLTLLLFQTEKAETKNSMRGYIAVVSNLPGYEELLCFPAEEETLVQQIYIFRQQAYFFKLFFSPVL